MAIDHFLNCTARWTPRWFNKPKFHVLRHLVAHIRRFGPAILFATEGFESFNAVIRIQSVHSNRHAPSRDIARGFASINRVRHLLSGGRFIPRSRLPSGQRSSPLPFSDRIQDWRTTGKNGLALCYARDARHNIVLKAFGLGKQHEISEPGTFVLLYDIALCSMSFRCMHPGQISGEALGGYPGCYSSSHCPR